MKSTSRAARYVLRHRKSRMYFGVRGWGVEECVWPDDPAVVVFGRKPSPMHVDMARAARRNGYVREELMADKQSDWSEWTAHAQQAVAATVRHLGGAGYMRQAWYDGAIWHRTIWVESPDTQDVRPDGCCGVVRLSKTFCVFDEEHEEDARTFALEIHRRKKQVEGKDGARS